MNSSEPFACRFAGSFAAGIDIWATLAWPKWDARYETETYKHRNLLA